MLKVLMMPLFVGGLLVLLSLALPQQVTTQEELGAVRFGLPIWFIEQDTRAVTHTIPTPVWVGLPQENPTTVQWERLASAWAILAAAVALTRYVFFGGRPSFSA